MPHVVCRRCQFRMDLLTVIDDERAREALAAALRLPAPVADAVQAYLALFESDTRGLTWPRYGAILAALVESIASGSVEWKGNRRPAPLALWVEAMTAMTATPDLSLPIRNHHYLRAMVYRKADSAEAEAEKQREQARRQKPPPAPRPSPAEDAQAPASASIADLARELKTQLTDMKPHSKRP